MHIVKYCFLVLTDCFEAGVSGYPEPEMSNRLCGGDYDPPLDGGVRPFSAGFCDGATSDGYIYESSCNEDCMKTKCLNEPLCVGYGKLGNRWRPISSIESLGPSNAWTTIKKKASCNIGTRLHYLSSLYT